MQPELRACELLSNQNQLKLESKQNQELVNDNQNESN